MIVKSSKFFEMRKTNLHLSGGGGGGGVEDEVGGGEEEEETLEKIDWSEHLCGMAMGIRRVWNILSALKIKKKRSECLATN